MAIVPQWTQIHIGSQFGKLTVIGSVIWQTTRRQKLSMFPCRCECNKEPLVLSANLLKGNTKSCGCRQTSGLRPPPKIHSANERRLNGIRNGMLARCYKPSCESYTNYGGRGIEVCLEWREHAAKFREWAFLNGYEPTLTLDRIDNNGNYEPSNCRWATDIMQHRNCRRNYLVTAWGETKCMAEWADDARCQTQYSVLRQRIREGQIPEQAISTPTRKMQKRI